MHFDVSLAFAFVCFLGLFGFVVTTLVPRLLNAIVELTTERLHARNQAPRKPRRSDDPEPLHGDWWGPTHHSQ